MKIKTFIVLIAAIALTSCAKSVKLSLNDAYNRYFNAWLKSKGYSELPRTPLGSYILISEEGDPERPVDNGRDTIYVMADYTVTNFNGEVTETTADTTAQILGRFDTTYFYGPRVLRIMQGASYAGVKEIIKMMNVGGRTKAIVPGWLMTYDNRLTLKDYLENSTGTEAIYDITVTDRIDNIKKWELDSLVHFVENNFPEIDPTDTTSGGNNSYGFYYVRTKEPESDVTLLKDTTIYINYTCRLLSGKVVDTTLKDIAKDAGFNVGNGKSYTPVPISMNSNENEIKMGTEKSSTIKGFTKILTKMHPYEAGSGMFISAYGYQFEGSGSRIPPFSPLHFEIEIVDKP